MDTRTHLKRAAAAAALTAALAGIAPSVAEAKPRDGTCAALANAAYQALANADHYERQGDMDNANYWMSTYRKAQQNITRRNC
ncbi:hypothetical protein QGN32_02475 [Mycolicibacterium sp. ND9-15]|uniref:hypothetical protein n=1 Tax=Mycolicibacterium sp. ND9-15 TaxID=3042320 RepID=UPI002DD81F13|nr:hypothetical protein [Mycolicibacterium sp. ND9-15]WSE56810.1 hypothetical protein QGN32_02475 [Mycolicibacterium sp. ND9-15]